MNTLNEFYNKSIKEEFLNCYKIESTKITYARIFTQSNKLEQKLDKDLFDFYAGEFKEVFFKLKPTSKTSSRTNGRIATKYIDWCIENGRKKSVGNDFFRQCSNPLRAVKPEWFDQFVVEKKIYISDNELNMIEEELKNAQDKIILRLIFEGVQGKGCKEITNLKKKDINFSTNTLCLEDEDRSVRHLEVSSKCMEIIKEALDEKEYLKKNGNMSTNAENLLETVKLVNNQYLIRNTIGQTKNVNCVDKHTIYRRLTSIRQYLQNTHPGLVDLLTVKSVARSGMLRMAFELFEQEGSIKKEHYEQIAERFKVNNVWSLREFITEDNIKELYPIKQEEIMTKLIW